LINGHTRTLDAKIADESGKKPFRMRPYTVIVANIRTLRAAETPTNSEFVGQRAQFGTKPAEYVLTFTDAYDS
jgi:hypothetical protein